MIDAPSPPPKTYVGARAWLDELGGVELVSHNRAGTRSVDVGALGRSASAVAAAAGATGLERAFLEAVSDLQAQL